MASKRKLVLTMILVAIGVMLVIAAVAWFAIVPEIIHSKLEEAFLAAEQKLGRKISLEDVSLRSLRHVTLKNMTIAGKNTDQPDITLDKLDLYLAGIPGFVPIRLSEIEAHAIQIQFDIRDGHHNYEDLLELLPQSKDSDETTNDTAAPPTWKRYIMPFPDVSVHAVHVVMPELPVAGKTKIAGLRANDIRITAQKPDFDFVVSLEGVITLAEGETKTEYRAPLQATLSSARQGQVKVMMPVSSSGEIPALFRPENYSIRATSLSWTLPSTFTLESPTLTEGEKTIFSAKQADIRLMALPPKKVNGVYFKEINLYQPVLNVELRDDGYDVYAFASAMKNALRPSHVRENEDAVGSVSGRSRNFKDYYFSQRFFIDDASVHLHDARTASRGDVELRHLNLESGYRSIRKVVDFRLTGEAVSPVRTEWNLNGLYHMKNEDIQLTLDIPSFSTTDETQAMRERLLTYFRENAPVPRSELRMNLFERLLSLVECQHATAKLHLDVAGNVKEKRASVSADITTNGFAISSPIISTEPFVLDSRFELKADVSALPLPMLTIHQGHITHHNAIADFTGSFGKEHVVVQKNSKFGGITEYDTWHFDFSLILPTQPAQTVFDAIPHALKTELDGLQASGNLSLKLTAQGRLDELDDIQHKLNIVTSDDFSIQAWPTDRDLTKLNTGFLFHVHDPNALTPHDVLIPASTHTVTVFDRVRRVMTDTYLPKHTADDIRVRFPNWILFEDLNPWLIQLITTTEDGSFFTHTGFSPLQIKAALSQNFKKGEFYRGASTISMQLIKNLFFDRSKTLARKAQEALYTWLMETILHIPKQRIMEIYFNIIEFGPEIYGIEEAAKYYFGKRSEALTLNEAAFLIAIIPGPRKGGTYRSQGAVTKGLQKTMDFYIREMYRRKCTPEMLAQMRARFEKRKQPVPFEPCCPSASSLELMQQQPITFYLPDPHDPLKYDYNPSLYLADGTPLIPVHRTCGYTQQADDSELGDIFGIFDP